MTEVVNEFDTWCQRNKLIFNFEKSMSIIFYNTLNTCFSQKVKFLGSQMHNRLIWEGHTGSVCKKLHRAYFAITQLKYSLDHDGLLAVDYAMAYFFIAQNILC